ncbi:sporulation integral membrane protein YtvI [Alkalicoccus halolimnae]|uniref:Sporulation integral membrane protein YtvI n=1 Tax=Alkalicoccus halolimnae TaxID=1667239 RepID=A0AAJ8LWJ8_9BACI|nr:sporulation integral membrane protein YtvI [Alkalicoccus halolimnae]
MTRSHAWIMLRLLFVLIFITAIALVVTWFFRIGYPFWIAALLVWMFYPLIRWLRNKLRFPNTLAVISALLLGISALGGAVTGLVFLIIFGVRRISDFLPQWIESTSRDIQNFFNQSIFPIWQQITGAMDSLTPEQQDAFNNGIATLGTRLAASLTEGGQGLTERLTQVLIFVPASLLVLLIIFLAFYFIGKDWDRIFSYIYSRIPDAFMKKSKEFKKMFQYRVLGFLRAQIILMFIASLLVLIGLFILRVDNALTIALIIGLAEVLPYLGSGTILIPWSLYMFFTGSISMGVGLAIVYGITMVVRQAIEPKILSTSMNLNALAVLVSLFVGFQLFGVVGFFLGPFILVIAVIFKDIGILDNLLHFIKSGFKEEDEKVDRNK